MDEHGPRISRSALARMTGATALGLAVAPEVAGARSRERSSQPPPAPRERAHGRPRRRRRHGFRRARGCLRPPRAARGGRALPGRRRARCAPRHRRRRARLRRPRRGHRRGDDHRHALRPRVDDEGARDGDGGDDPRRPAQALADGAGRDVPAGLRGQRQGRRARARPAALLLRPARRQPEGRHGRHRRDLGLHGADGARVSDRLAGRVLGPRLPPARPPRRDRRRHEPRRVRQARDLGPARHARHDLQPVGVARAALRRDRPGLARSPSRPAARTGAGRPGLEGRRHRRVRRRLRDRARRRRSSARRS